MHAGPRCVTMFVQALVAVSELELADDAGRLRFGRITPKFGISASNSRHFKDTKKAVVHCHCIISYHLVIDAAPSSVKSGTAAIFHHDFSNTNGGSDAIQGVPLPHTTSLLY
jgi:hypothetical protein